MEVVLLRRGDFKRWRRCRLKDHFWRTQGLRPRFHATPLVIGTALHQAMSSYYTNGQRTEEALVTAFIQALPEFPKDVVIKPRDAPINIARVLGEYHEFAKKYDQGLKFLQPEMAVAVHLFLPDKRFIGMWIGRLDGLVQRSDGSYWIMDHKTMSQFRVQHFDFDEQFTGYVWAARIATGLPIKGVMINAIRKKRGEPPNVKRFWTLRSEPELKSYHQGLIDQYLDIQRSRRIYPNLTRDCTWDCPYVRDLCPAWRKGIQLQPFIKENYIFSESTEDYEWEEGE